MSKTVVFSILLMFFFFFLIWNYLKIKFFFKCSTICSEYLNVALLSEMLFFFFLNMCEIFLKCVFSVSLLSSPKCVSCFLLWFIKISYVFDFFSASGE